MDRVRPLRGVIRHYAWGSREAIAAWAGRPVPSPQPEAELWLGAHPGAPSDVVLDDGSSEPLDRWIARDPGRALGERAAEFFGPVDELETQAHDEQERGLLAIPEGLVAEVDAGGGREGHGGRV